MEKFLNLPIEKQNKVIDAALLSFGVNGYKKASASDIAAAAGISKAMIFHYFGTKKDLYLFLVDYCSDLIMKEINDKFDNHITDFFDRITVSSQIKISVLYRHPAAMAFLTSCYFESDEEVAEGIKAILSRSEEVRKKIAFDGIDTSKFKDGINPQSVLKILVWMAEGFASTFKATGFTIESMDAFIKEYNECMELLKNNFYKEEYLK